MRLPVLTRRALLALAALVPGLRAAHAERPAPQDARAPASQDGARPASQDGARPASQDGARPARPVLRLSCPDDAPEALCRALVQALAHRAPGHVIRRVDAAELRPGRAGDLGLALVMLAPAGDGVRARLDRQPATGALQTGPAVTDPALSAAAPPRQPAEWDGFARALAQTVTPAAKTADPENAGHYPGTAPGSKPAAPKP